MSAYVNLKCRAAGGSCDCSNSDAITCPDQHAPNAAVVSEEQAVSIVPDWPFCNPGCDYEDPHGGMHDGRSAGCSCEAAKVSIARQRPAAPAPEAPPNEFHKDFCQKCCKVHASVDCAPAAPTAAQAPEVKK